MKFLVKISRNYLIVFAVILMISSVAGYYLLHQIILSATKESLIEKERLLIEQIKDSGEIPNLYPVVEVKELRKLTGTIPEFKKILIQNDAEDELEPFLEYSSEININGSIYSIKLRQSSFENEDLVIILALSFFVIISVSFGISYFISKKMNRTIWADFESNLQAIEHFNFNGNKKIELLKSNIEEFDRLNREIEHLTLKLQTDYLSLKEFTENASHEIQTPLSVALLHLDELLQQDLNKEAFERTISSIQALKRISSLNQSLILLAKIENKQFKADKLLSFKRMIQNKIEEFAPLFESKKLHVELKIERDFLLKINGELAEVLLNNLLSNAINHNLDGGSIRLELTNHKLGICNTGGPNALTNETVFNRFSKGNPKSFGLGLAIVKKICDTHHLEIQYNQNKMHCFTIIKLY